MTDFSFHHTHAQRYPAARPSVLAWLTNALGVHRSRRQLAKLEDHQLEDIGVARKAAEKEANRPIWDVPAHWLK